LRAQKKDTGAGEMRVPLNRCLVAMPHAGESVSPARNESYDCAAVAALY
jgi:hypothetical protein